MTKLLGVKKSVRYVLAIVLMLLLSTVSPTVLVRPVIADGGNNYPYVGDTTFPGCAGDPWGECKRYCTSWTAWALQDRNGFVLSGNLYDLGNANQWKGKAVANGYTVDSNPATGAVAWYDAHSWNGGYGHVAWVEKVNSQSSIIVEEYNWNLDGTYNPSPVTVPSSTQTVWPDGFIHFKDIPNDPTPPTISWNFENLEGGTNPTPVSSYQGDVGHTPASVVFNSQLYNYYYDSTRGDLRVAYTHPGWLFDVVDGEGGGSGKLNADEGQVPSTVVFNNTMYVFYYDNSNGNLRMAWSTNGTSWQAETLDGDSGSLSGYNANVGQTPYVAVYNNSLQLFYYQPDQGLLRHAWSSNGSSWNFETLDGNSSSVSHFSGNVGLDPSVAVYNGALEVLYTNSSQGDLRHAWADANGWHFENLDGDAGSVGHSGNNVGGNPTAFVFQSNLGVLYYDKTIGALRHAWADASGWHFEVLAANSGAVLNVGTNIGSTSTAVVDGTTLQVFAYENVYGDLEHIWNDGSWHAENLDGAGGSPSGRLNANEGQDPDAIMFGNTLDVFYYDADNGALRHTWPN